MNVAEAAFLVVALAAFFALLRVARSDDDEDDEMPEHLRDAFYGDSWSEPPEEDEMP